MESWVIGAADYSMRETRVLRRVGDVWRAGYPIEMRSGQWITMGDSLQKRTVIW
jgi:hypothetical protein